MNTLCKICGRHALLPSTFQIPLCFDQSERAPYSGGYADVWVGDYLGRKVAVKVLKVYSTNDFNKITSVSHHSRLVKSAYRTADDRRDRTDVLQGSCDVEEPPTSECAPAVGSDDGGKALCDGFGMDGQWEYCRFCRDTSGGKSVRARRVSLPPLTPPVADEITPDSLKALPGG